MLPFSPEDLDTVTAIALENTAGVVPHLNEACVCEGMVVARLSVTGPWECDIEIAVEKGLAEWLTQQMWDQDTVQDDEVRDAVGEIANVIAGGVKGMTPQPGCGLTLPVVTIVQHLDEPTAGALRRCYSVMQKPIVVTTSVAAF